jgi:hypothetical protein
VRLTGGDEEVHFSSQSRFARTCGQTSGWRRYVHAAVVTSVRRCIHSHWWYYTVLFSASGQSPLAHIAYPRPRATTPPSLTGSTSYSDATSLRVDPWRRKARLDQSALPSLLAASPTRRSLPTTAFSRAASRCSLSRSTYTGTSFCHAGSPSQSRCTHRPHSA